MKILDIGSKRHTQVYVMDEPGAGGACHEYRIGAVDAELDVADQFGTVSFQNGPVKENGVNGCHQEDLLAIVIHRLRCFQAGPYACRENALALVRLEEAMFWLNQRTAERDSRGVEGTSAV